MKRYRVERAIILAAGMGSRMAPVTDSLPKPLVSVNGKRIITTLLDAVLSAGIREIYIVCGYRAGCFAVLKKEYPMLRFIQNPLYACANNIASVVYAGNLVRNAYILEGDLLLRNPGLITAWQSETNYLAIPVQWTEDWCFFVDKERYIRKMAIGGQNCEQMVGISYWTPEDGARLAACARALFRSPGGANKYWDQVALETYLSEFRIKVRECRPEDVVEIDTLAELQTLDASYR